MKSFRVPIYDVPVTLVVTTDECERACRKVGVDLDEEDLLARGKCIQHDYEDGKVAFVLAWFDNEMNTLAHEATHLAHFILMRAGIDPRDSDGETMAYLVGWVVDKCLPKHKK